jgi:hypothetical protein
MNRNPYGAVPEALKETRLTLRDLMTAHLENKVAEGRLGLEKAKADTELAMVGANIKRDEIASLRDTARMKQDADQFGLGLMQRQKEQDVNAGFRERELSQTHDFRNRELDMQAKRDKISADTARHALEKKPVSVWLQQSGIDPRVAPLLGFTDTNQTLTREDARHLAGNLAGYVPHLEAGLAAQDMRAIQDALPKAKPEELPALQQKYETAARRFAISNQRIKGISDSGKTKLANKMQEEGKTPQEIAEFISELETGLQQAKTAGDVLGNNVESFNDLRAKISVDPLYDKRSDEAVRTILQLAPKELATSIDAGYKARIKKKDFRGAYEYLRGYAYQLDQKRAGSNSNPTGGSDPESEMMIYP